jgi:hypothetical protein
MDLQRIAKCLHELADALDSSDVAAQQLPAVRTGLTAPHFSPCAPVSYPDGGVFVFVDTTNNSWHGISRAARQLKVTPQHLARVLRGERQSKRLSKRVTVKEVQ